MVLPVLFLDIALSYHASFSALEIDQGNNLPRGTRPGITVLHPCASETRYQHFGAYVLDFV
jgi:hypothetical protein